MMIRASATVFILFLAMTCRYASAQYFSTGQEPASIRWKQIKARHVKVVFPEYYESAAPWLAAYIDEVSPLISSSLNCNPRRIPLLLHTQSATSNALVAWAPARMEFYTTPGQDIYPQPWLEQLVLHEYRHVVQISKLEQGLTRVIGLVFGQQGTAAILGLYVPPWFLEGDAICSETALSRSGRGRQPLFEMKLRTQLLEKGAYTFDKAVFGSYRDFVPNHYELGYHLVAWGRKEYGAGIWEHTLNRVAKRPYMVTPFQKGIRDVSGKRKRPFYQACMTELQALWEVQDAGIHQSGAHRISTGPDQYTSYRHPFYISDTLILAMRSGLDDITRFVGIGAGGSERIIFTPGYLKTETLSCAAGKICWIETRPDPRWQNRSYTVVRIHDLASRKTNDLKVRMRLFAPALSDDGSMLAAVHADSLGRYAILVMDASSASVIKRIPVPVNTFPQMPAWAGDEMLIAILLCGEGKCIAKFDLASGRSKMLTQWDYADISQPVYHAPYVFFTGSWSGISDIYALHLEQGGIYQVTDSRFGALDPGLSDDGSRLLFSDYTAMGHRILALPVDPDEWRPLNEVEYRSAGLHEAIALQETPAPDGSDITPAANPSKRYSKASMLFNFHSWAPLGIDVSSYSIRPGISVMSQNLLSSSFLSAGYGYNLAEEAGTVYGEYSYRGWYPVIDLYAGHGLRREYVYIPGKTAISWKETNLRAGLRLPLQFRKGRYQGSIQPQLYAQQSFRRISDESPVSFRKNDIFSMGYSLSLTRQAKMSYRDIYPAWGQALGLYYRDTPFDRDNNSYLAAATASLYVPGILRHHGLNIYAGYQQRQTGDYKFSDMVAYPRGYSALQDEELFTLRLTYVLPLACPDWSLGPVLYLKRIRGAVFGDYAEGLDQGISNIYRSCGADLIFETHILRFVAPFDLGIRGVYFPDTGAGGLEFIFGFGMGAFYGSQGSDPGMPVF
jgi:hypothetical protein